MNYLLRTIFIVSLLSFAICSLIIWQQWSPFTPGYPDQRNFLNTIEHIREVAGFLFFAAALTEAWAGSLDKRISALVLGAFIVERFQILDITERNILIGVAICCVVVDLWMLRHTKQEPEAPVAATNPRPVIKPLGGSRVNGIQAPEPMIPEDPQPQLAWSKARRLINFIAYGDLDARRGQKEQDKKSGIQYPQ